MTDLYVIVADNDKPFQFKNSGPFVDDMGPLIFEQYTKTADLESIKKRVEYLNGKYGKCRIARLEFIEEKDND